MSGAATLFVAIELSEPVRRALIPLLTQVANIDPKLRPVRAEGLHLTLRYLGQVEADRQRSIQSVASRVAAAAEPFPLALGGLGTFPEGDRPRVVWLGVDSGGIQLGRLADELAAGLAQVGWEPEARPFRPHCTVARIAGRLSPSAGSRLAEVCRRGWPGPPLETGAESLSLLESVSVPGGSNRYPCRERWQLGPS